MKKFLLSMLTCCVCAGAWAQGTLNVPEVNRKGGTVNQAIIVKKSASREGVVKIQLANSANYRDMQFDLTLPDGISLVTEPTTENPVVKVDAKEGQNHVLFYALEGQTVKIAVVDNVVNLPETTQTASAEDYGKYLADGIVFELPIQATADFTDVKNATIANLAFTDDAATADITATAEPFGIAMIQLGDVTDDGNVDISDAQASVAYSFNNPPSVFVEEVADLTENGAIDISDAQALVALLFAGSSSTPAKQFVEDEVENELDPE